MPFGFSRLPRFRPRQVLKAEDLNGLVDAVNAFPELVAGKGITLHRGPDGKYTISAAGVSGGESLYGVITAATGNSSGDWLENIRYSAVVRGKPEAKITGRLPDFGRTGAGRDYQAKPCAVGCPCIVLRIPDAAGVVQSYLQIFEGGEKGERPLFKQCGSPAGARSADPLILPTPQGPYAGVVVSTTPPPSGSPSGLLFDDADNSAHLIFLTELEF